MSKLIERDPCIELFGWSVFSVPQRFWAQLPWASQVTLLITLTTIQGPLFLSLFVSVWYPLPPLNIREKFKLQLWCYLCFFFLDSNTCASPEDSDGFEIVPSNLPTTVATEHKRFVYYLSLYSLSIPYIVLSSMSWSNLDYGNVLCMYILENYKSNPINELSQINVGKT